MILRSHEEDQGKILLVESFAWTKAPDSPLWKGEEPSTSQVIWKGK